MEGESTKHQVLHRQAREIVFWVFNFKREAEVRRLLSNFARVQERTVSVCGIGIRSVQIIIGKAKKNVKNSNGNVQFKSLNKIKKDIRYELKEFI